MCFPFAVNEIFHFPSLKSQHNNINAGFCETSSSLSYEQGRVQQFFLSYYANIPLISGMMVGNMAAL